MREMPNFSWPFRRQGYDPRHNLCKWDGMQPPARTTGFGTEQGARIATDQHYRVSDLAVDFAEDGARLSAAEIDRIAADGAGFAEVAAGLLAARGAA